MSKELVITGVFIAATGLIVWGALDAGRAQGKAACQAEMATANATAQATANTQTKTAIKRATTAGQAQEKSRAAVDQFFDQLQKDVSHAQEQAAAPADTCSLSAARLRLWNYANTGLADSSDSDTAAAQPDASTPTAAPSSLRQAGRSGSQPPPGDQVIPPAGGPNVQPLGLAGDQP